MKLLKYINITLTLLFLIGCDDQILPELNDAETVLVIDALVNDKFEDQIIKVSRTQPYFDNSQIDGVEGAEVFITDDTGTRFDFVDTGAGTYTWIPPTADGFGQIGDKYELTVIADGDIFKAESEKNRVPIVDSISFEWHEADFGLPDSYTGQFWSRDLEGTGDTYWIKAFKNEQFLSKPSEINIAWDAGFSEGGEIDNLIFIPPIRDAVNPFDNDPDKDNSFLSPYKDGDSLYVEIHSITHAAHAYFNELRIQTDRPGGFAELFATPLSNISTNITNTTSNNTVLGFFCVSAVEGNGKILDISTVPKN